MFKTTEAGSEVGSGILSHTNAARFLKVTPTTLTQFVDAGELKPRDGFYNEDELLALQNRLMVLEFYRHIPDEMRKIDEDAMRGHAEIESYYYE